MHRATPRFWDLLNELPGPTQEIAHRNFQVLKQDPRHPSLQFKKVGNFWSARVGQNYRALAVEDDEGLTWVWIGSHQEYDRMIRRGP